MYERKSRPRMRAAFFIVLCYERGPEGKVKQILTNGLTRAPDAIGRLLMRDTSVFDWIKTDPRRKAIREDRRYVVGRTERFLRRYLSVDGRRKQRFYVAVEGATAACRPVIDPLAEDAQIARATANAAGRS